MKNADCYECGNRAVFVELDYPFTLYCVACINSYGKKKEEE